MIQAKIEQQKAESKKWRKEMAVVGNNDCINLSQMSDDDCDQVEEIPDEIA